MFLKGTVCELRVLEMSDHEAATFTKAVNAGLTTEWLWTGSIPMAPIDTLAVWKKEREAGSIEFGVWVEGKFCGTTGLYSKRDVYREWEFRILIFDPDCVGKGIGSEATWLVVAYCFRRMNGWRCYLGVNEMNERAVRCYRQVGFVQEGLLRDAIYTYGRYYNAVRMSILRPEWEELCKVRGVEITGPIP